MRAARFAEEFAHAADIAALREDVRAAAAAVLAVAAECAARVAASWAASADW
jgi:hypothetical protein